MRIGMILDEKYPPDPRVENEARVLIREGHQVYLLSLDYQGNQLREETIHEILVQRVSYSRLMHKLSALAYTVPLYHFILSRAIKKFIRRNHIQALHLHDLQVARAGFFARGKAKIPILLDLHENRPEIMKYYRHLNRFPGRYLIYPSRWKKKEAEYIRKSDHTIVVTNEAREYYQQNLSLPPQKFVVVPNTVSRDFYQEYSTDEHITDRYRKSFMILYIGDTGERRGIETLLKAVSILANRIDGLRFCILGRSTNDSQLRELVNRLQIADKVDFEGWQSPAKFQSYILSSQLCSCPILRNIHHDTTYANKLFQYASLAKPLLVSDCTAQKNLTEKYKMGLVFEAGNEEDCAKKILYLANNKKELTQYGNNGQKAVLEFLGWEKVSQQLVGAYKNLTLS
ncbi:MAG: glycosyltransferase [Bacteroidales bacterium]|nr:glycosyltransferase [Bacteroidales bacterium]